MPQQTFWSRILRPGAGGPWGHLAADHELRAFLARRLSEELTAAERRLLASPESSQAVRAVQLLDELIDGLRRGHLPDETTLQVLTTVYGDDPDFCDAWGSSTVHATP